MGEGKAKAVMNAEAVEETVNDLMASQTVTDEINNEVFRVVREQVKPHVARHITKHIQSSIDRGFLDKVVRAHIDRIIATALEDLSIQIIAALEQPMADAVRKYVDVEWPKRVDAVAGKALQEALAKVRAEFKP